MRKILSVLAIAAMCVLSFASAAGAQVQGTVTTDVETVPEAGEYTFMATGADFIPDSTLLLTGCTSPADPPLVAGVSELEDVVAAADLIQAAVHCDIGNASSITTDGDGAFSAEITVTVGENFFLSAGAIDGSQSGGVWIPIVAAAPELAVTGVESGVVAGGAVALILLGAGALRFSRRLEDDQ